MAEGEGNGQSGPKKLLLDFSSAVGLTCNNPKIQLLTLSLCLLQPINSIFFYTKPAPASSYQPVSSIFLSQQISTSHQPQHSEQSDWLDDLTQHVILPTKVGGIM